nr:MAG TPA: hypothetical protein [Caudoviricetes sp.]
MRFSIVVSYLRKIYKAIKISCRNHNLYLFSKFEYIVGSYNVLFLCCRSSIGRAIAL